jgi:lambda family phage portal protein
MKAPAILDSSGQPMRRANAFQASSRQHQDMMTWNPGRYSAQSALTYERDTIADRVHDIARNDGWASAAMDRQVDSIIGAGWRLSAKPNGRSLGIHDVEALSDFADTIEAEWEDYANNIGFYCDVGRRGPAGSVLALAYRHRVMDGEALAVLYWLERGGRYATAVQVIDPDRLSNPFDRVESETLRGGVEMDAVGAAVAYHIRRQHPGDDMISPAYALEWERVERETEWGRPVVLHAFEPLRAGAVRGVSPLAPILRKLKQVTRYDEAELQAATLNAVLAAFFTSPQDPDQFAESIASGELSRYQGDRLDFYKEKPLRLPGVQANFLYPGEDVKLTAPSHPNSVFEAFVRTALRNVASAAGITYEQLTMDWSQVNYSSARAALIEVWRSAVARKGGFAAQFMQPWYAAFLEEAFARGRIKPPKGAPSFAEKRTAYCRADWIGPARGWVDPQKEAEAAVTRLDADLSNLEREHAEQGTDWRESLFQSAREDAYRKKLGLPARSLRTSRPSVAEPAEETTPT